MYVCMYSIYYMYYVQYILYVCMYSIHCMYVCMYVSEDRRKLERVLAVAERGVTRICSPKSDANSECTYGHCYTRIRSMYECM